MNYEFVHLSLLTRLVMKGEKLSNEDFIFLTGLRGSLRIANEQLSVIDNRLADMEQYA